MNKLAIACIRQPSMGPTFGVKGGAAGLTFAPVIGASEGPLTGIVLAIDVDRNSRGTGVGEGAVGGAGFLCAAVIRLTVSGIFAFPVLLPEPFSVRRASRRSIMRFPWHMHDVTLVSGTLYLCATD